MDLCFFFFKQKTAYEMRISEWSSDVCSSDLLDEGLDHALGGGHIADPTVRHDGHGPSRSRLLRCRPRQEAPPEGLGRDVGGTRVSTEWTGNSQGCDTPGRGEAGHRAA